MYVIAVYDVASERTPKMLKLCRKYLHWIQNSVFEGELSPLQLKELVAEAHKIMDESYDSFILFKSRHKLYLDKQIEGKRLTNDSQFL
jgi:CRISPR-associated protein Cas2